MQSGHWKIIINYFCQWIGSFESHNELKKGEELFSSQIYSISQSMVRSTWFQVLTFSKSDDMNPSNSEHGYILLSLFQTFGQLGRDRKRAGRRAGSAREKGVGKRSIGEKEGWSRELSFPRPFLFLYQTPLVARFRSQPLFSSFSFLSFQTDRELGKLHCSSSDSNETYVYARDVHCRLES